MNNDILKEKRRLNMDPRQISLREQEEELKHSSEEVGEEVELAEEEVKSNKKTFSVHFKAGGTEIALEQEEGSMKVALSRSFERFKKTLPKRTKLREVSIIIKQV